MLNRLNILEVQVFLLVEKYSFYEKEEILREKIRS